MRAHDVERAKARRAQEVASNRMRRKAQMKRTATMTVKSAAAAGLVGAGIYAANKYGNVNISMDQVNQASSVIKRGRKVMSYFY